MKDKTIITEVTNIQEDLPAPWDKTSETADQYIARLKSDLEGVRDLLQGRSQDCSMVQSAVEETVGLLAYASVQKELHSLKAILQSYATKEKHHGTIGSKGADQGARLPTSQGAPTK